MQTALHIGTRFAVALLILLRSLNATADLCAEARGSLAQKHAGNIEYTARVFEAGHRFSVAGASYEVTRTPFTVSHNKRRYAVLHPVLVDANDDPRLQDFFVRVETRENLDGVCNDVLFNGENPQHPVSVKEESSSIVQFGDFDKSAKSLVSTRTLAARMRVRIDGTEIVVATGFSARKSLNISDCAKNLDDSYGFVEYAPGRIKIACFPADPKRSNYVDEIEWRVDYQWPVNPPALLDELIDYVYVEAQ